MHKYIIFLCIITRHNEYLVLHGPVQAYQHGLRLPVLGVQFYHGSDVGVGLLCLGEVVVGHAAPEQALGVRGHQGEGWGGFQTIRGY